MTESRTIGEHFQIEEVLGQGGMATVYRGTDLRDGSTVAIKLLKPEVVALDPDIVERFEREGEALRRLNHPNIVKVLATVKEDDENYVVMEHVGGGDLRDLLERYRQDNEAMPVARVLEIALDLSDALTRAHRLNIVHRDIKPANVLIAKDGTPRLTDFGVARMTDSTRMTQTGALVGTMAYLSPEGCTGEELDARADIWAFGVMLYEMLTLERPFHEESTAALIYAILSKGYPDLVELRPDAPLALVNLINMMLVKEREERIGSVRLVGAQIEAIIQGVDVPTSVDTTPTPAVTEDVETIALPSSDDSNTLARRSAITTTVRQLSRTPQVYISYRPTETGAAAGRIYDRLTAEFGDPNVVKDVSSSIPTANLTDVIRQEVQARDVLLVIIGPEWQNAAEIHEPDNIIRQEIEAAFQREDMLVIPVLVDGALIPSPSYLPESLQGLAYRNAAVIRNDPDFNRDIQWLVGQINNNFEIEQPGSGGRRGLLFSGIALVAALIVIAALVILSSNPDSATDDVPTQASDEIILVEPVAEDENLILVADMEYISGTERDVSRFIVSDLAQVLDEDSDFSKLRIRAYPQVITSAERAFEVAEANRASVIIWGNYDDESVNVDVQLGPVSLLEENPFSQEDLEDIANGKLRIDNERVQSLAASVVAAMNILHTANSNSFDVAVNLTTLEVASPENPTVVGNNAAARWHRYLQLFQTDAGVALEELNQALDIEINPIIYLGRSLAFIRLGRLEEANQDMRTAQTLSPDGWLMPTTTLAQAELFLHNDYEAAFELSNQIVEANPDDWYALTLRGGAAFFLGDYEQAEADLKKAIGTGNAELNYPYFVLTAVTLRKGNLLESLELIDTIQEVFPDPSLTERLLKSGYGITEDSNIVGASGAAFGNFVIGQWSRVIEIVTKAEAMPGFFPDMYLLRGLAHCNLDDPAAAEADYTTVIESDPNFTLAYVLRIQVRAEQNNLVGALADATQVLNSEQASVFTSLIPAVQDGEMNCKNMLNVDLSQYFELTPEAGS